MAEDPEKTFKITARLLNHLYNIRISIQSQLISNSFAANTLNKDSRNNKPRVGVGWLEMVVSWLELGLCSWRSG